MRTNPIRPRDHKSEPNRSKAVLAGSETEVAKVANVGAGGSTVSPRSAEAVVSVSMGGIVVSARSAEAACQNSETSSKTRNRQSG